MTRNMISRMIRLGFAVAVLALTLVAPSSALAKDRDHDRMPDRWEKKHGLSFHKANARRDKDGDGLSNIGEFKARTDPSDADTDDDCIGDDNEDADRDGVDNDDEVREHTNPRQDDSDDDGVDDGDEDADHDGVANRDDDEDGADDADDDAAQCGPSFDDDDQGDDENGDDQGDDGDDD
jgi:hypothetical protein